MPSLQTALDRHAAARPDAAALRLGEMVVSYGKLQAKLATRTATLAQLAPQEAPRLIPMENTPECVAELLAHLFAGHGVLPYHGHLPAGEVDRLRRQAEKVDAAAHRIENSTRRAAASTTLGWLCLPSSGTTGLPKLVRRPLATLDAMAASIAASAGLREDDRVLAAVPLSHSYGLENGLLGPLYAGATVELENTFDPGRLHARLRETGATVLPAVPVMAEMLVRLHDGASLPQLRLVYCAGAPLPPSLWGEARKKSGLPFGVLYGATEIGSAFFELGEAPGFDPACVGFPMEGVRWRLGTDGEVFLHAPTLMTGYWNAESSGLEADGFFATGDLGERTPEGRLRLIGRKKLMMDVGGSKVNPLEVEAILREAPGVKLCVVVPEPVSDTVCRVKALVVMADGHAFDQVALKAHCKAQLAAHKVPRIFEQRGGLPVSATGKVLRGSL